MSASRLPSRAAKNQRETHTPVVASSTVVSKKGSIVESEKANTKTLAFVAITEPCAKIAVEAGHTLNQGNYNSVRYSVRVEMPCKADEASIKKAYQWINQYIDNELSTHYNELVEGELSTSKGVGVSDADDDFEDEEID